MNEVGCRLEENVQVEVRGVVCRNATVDEGVAVEALVPDAASLGVSGVQYVGDAESLQGRLVLGHRPAGRRQTGVRAAGTVPRPKQPYSHVPDVDLWPDLVHFIQVEFARIQDLLQVLHRGVFFSLQVRHVRSKSPFSRVSQLDPRSQTSPFPVRSGSG